MKLIDISVPLYPGMPKYPSLRDFEHSFDRSFAAGDSVNLSVMRMQMHLGTHVDAPKHYMEDGIDISAIPLEVFFGNAWVIHVQGPQISAKEIDRIPRQFRRVLFRTSEAGGDVPQESWFSDEASLALAARMPLLVGVESSSVDRAGRKDKFVHHTLLGKGIVLIEGLRLSHVTQGAYLLSAAPLNIMGAEGAPCRAFLQELQ